MSVIRQKHKSEYLFRVWGIAMHLVILWGVLDANFHSPVLRNLSPVPPVKEPPAKRLFLFVADGLRYKTFAKSTPNFLGPSRGKPRMHGKMWEKAMYFPRRGFHKTFPDAGPEIMEEIANTWCSIEKNSLFA
ncbi:uncharacterized protein [Fopius arisanus]|uniref:GPI ethanolamine phosphate transferase 1 n=1 Tax=Fopius arisanus TaxID=64838 RepID=A0A9R1TPF2_9HYME|nr:PREDICTED: uncharacterized protein LOC105272504 [Fopius arisanus]